jgi:aryl-alcohol dehydrogenase-like predicted oxidoreductase
MENILQRHILGTAGLGGVWNPVDHEESVATILKALESGVTTIDTAPAYADAELLVGRALQQWCGVRPHISTKVGRLKSFASDNGLYDYSAKEMTASLQQSLEILGISYVDVLFLHEPDVVPVADIEQSVRQMLEFKHQGYAKKIGLCGNSPASFQQYIDAGVFDVAMEYNRLDACCADALDTTLPAYINKGMSYWAASPLHMGLLGRRFHSFITNRPDWLPQGHIDKAIAVNKIAVNNNLSLSSLALRFLQNIPYPIRIVTGPANLQELDDCLTNIAKGPLEGNLYHKIISQLQKINN